MRVLITGVNGFVGTHLTDYLLIGNNEVHGVDMSAEPSKYLNPRMNYSRVNLKFHEEIRDAVSSIKPDCIYHLAAISSVATSWKDINTVVDVNVKGTINLLESVRLAGINPSVLVVGSSEEYGITQETITERTPLNPSNPYAVTKLTADLISYQYHLKYGMKVIRVRPLSHTGPRQNANFVVSDFANQIALIENGKQEPVIMVGNIDVKRDFTDVRDMVRAYCLAVDKCVAGDVYNICSGNTYKIADLLDMLLSFSKTKIRARTDETKFRPVDVEEIKGDCSKFAELTGYKPEIKIEKTLRDVLEYWRGIPL